MGMAEPKVLGGIISWLLLWVARYAAEAKPSEGEASWEQFQYGCPLPHVEWSDVPFYYGGSFMDLTTDSKT